MVKLKKSLDEFAEENKKKYRAKSVRYEPRGRKLYIQTECGEQKAFRIDLLQGLSGASDEAAADIEILAAGSGLHWPSLNASLLVHKLCMGIYGSNKWMKSI